MKEIVLIPDPHIQSRAALVALRKKYKFFDVASYSYWLRFRFALLTRWLAAGPLHCNYCGKGPLHIEHPNIRQVATLDHVMPLARGGAKFDEGNLVVACSLCNGKKADKIEGWLSQSSSAIPTTSSASRNGPVSVGS